MGRAATSVRRMRGIGRELGALARRTRGESWRYYASAAGANTLGEASLALKALLGMTPLQDGPAIAEYERRFAAQVNATHAFAFGAGRMALYALLEALDVGPGDEVILPGFTCVVVPNAILYRGAKPVYVDIDARTFNVDSSQLESKITPRTKAIVAQHTFGLVCDVDAINDIASRHGVVVIEDGAHALGASTQGRPVGSLTTAAFFSTDHTKVIGTATGGMVTTSDDALASRLSEIQRRTPFLPLPRLRKTLAVFIGEVLLLQPALAPIGRVALSWWLRPGRETPFFPDELRTQRPDAYPYPARLGNAQALIGLSQLARLPQNLAARRRSALLYDERLGTYAGLLEPGAANHAFVRYVFLSDDRDAWEHRFGELADMGIWFTSVVHGRADRLDEVGYRAGSCPVGEHAAKRCVNLPTHPRVGRPDSLLARLGDELASVSGSEAFRARVPTT